MKKIKKITALFLALCMVAALCACGSTGKTNTDTVTLKFAHPVSEDSNTHRLALKMKEEVEALSNGTHPGSGNLQLF